MGDTMNLAEQFSKSVPVEYNYGDRVYARLDGFSLVGMVIRQTEMGVLIHADLPLKLGDEIRNVMWCEPDNVKRLVEIK